MVREIRFLTDDGLKSQNCVFRAVYLMKILDLFADELGQLTDVTTQFRSRALNPILQRRLRGVDEHEPEQVALSVGKTLEEAADFYLTLDPLDPEHIETVLRNLLYIWPVRFSISFLNAKGTDDAYGVALENTLYLLSQRELISDEDWVSAILTEAEFQLIDAEHLSVYYETLINRSVRIPYVLKDPPNVDM